MNQSGGQTAFATVERLIRIHNALFLLMVVVALGCVAVVNTTHIYPNRPDRIWLMNVAAVGLPVLAMIVTAALTNRFIQTHVERWGDVAASVDSVAPLFFRAKLTSMVLLTGTGLFGGVCLLFGHRATEAAIAAFPAVLMLVTRPSHGNVEQFVVFVEMARQERFGTPPQLSEVESAAPTITGLEAADDAETQ